MSSRPHDEGGRSPESVDRLMVVGCGAVWLVLLVVAVIASVGLVNLGRGDDAGQQSPWLLYTVIVVSGLTILGAIPLLLRARRDAERSADEPPAESAAPLPLPGAPAEKMRVFGTAVDPRRGTPAVVADSPLRAAVERVWLRGTASLAGAIGLALTAVATATYLLTAGNGTAAVVALALAGVITVGIPVLAVLFSRRVDGAVSLAR